MRKTVPILVLAAALAGCNGADRDANAAADTADNAGEAIADAVGETADTLGEGIADAGNSIVGAVEPGKYDDWIGRWTGVEGMYLDIARAEGGGGEYTLEMQYDLDHEGTYHGTAAADGIRFEREGETYTLRHTDGDATGLKYLAGKSDCLTVKQGEGYCRE